ncbi:MAG: ZIP family metal transporter [Sphaerochaetaceae bacterium]|nr:ZIP family metal transporter [Sphaerochaetaceae bacterium]MDC7249764.1 ZIP family metal transporter [Sphaerochaetaceae bacterium]
MNKVILGLMIPFIGTTLGSAMVLLMKKDLSNHIQKILLGFASGVMIAASVWSLLLPALDMAAAQGVVEWVPAAVGFLFGIFFLLALDKIIPHLHAYSDHPEGMHSHLKKRTMLVLAVTLHNIPEGMAVGVVFAGVLSNNPLITLSSAFVLAIGIAIQNFPEGAIISMPLHAEGVSKKKSFLYGTLSGIVEPIAGILTIFLTQIISGLLPYFLSFAAGAMIYVVVEELVPESQVGDHSDVATISVAIGFVIMMVLDVALG